jgi:hypothetical protein
MQWIEPAHSQSFSELEILLVTAFSPDAAHFLFPFSQREARTNQYRTELMKLIFDSQEEDRKLFLTLLNRSYPPAKEKLVAMKKTLVLYHWLNEVPTAELERGYRAYFGAIAHLGAEFAWLVQALAGLAQSTPLGANGTLTKLVTLSERLRYGVKENSLPLARLNVPGLGRMRIARLVQQGCDTPESVQELDGETLAKLVSKPVAERLKKIERTREPKKTEVLPPVKIPNSESEFNTLHLLGIPIKKRTSLKINNREIALRNRDYLILLKLVVACKNGSNGWRYRDEVDAPDNFGRNISRLRCALRRYQKQKKYPLIENDMQGYYRLNLPPENVVIEFANFNQHWNQEFQEIVNQLQPVTELR